VKCLAFLPCVFDELSYFDELNILKNGRKIGKCHQGTKLIIFSSLLDYLEFLSNDLNKNQLYLIGDHFNKKSQELARPLNKMCQEKFHNHSQKIEISLNKRIKQGKEHRQYNRIDTANRHDVYPLNQVSQLQQPYCQNIYLNLELKFSYYKQ
jgi:hypothetical protein